MKNHSSLRRGFVCSLLCTSLVLVAGSCASEPPEPECVGCSSSEFCCLGVCSPLGTACGGYDGGSDANVLAPADASVAGPDAFDRCSLPPMATSVASVCVGNVATSCTNEEQMDCRRLVCIDWTDTNGVGRASCAQPQETEACDFGTYAARCDGRMALHCVPTHPGPPDPEWPTPSGYVSRRDCHLHAPDAICRVVDGLPECFSPTDVPCDERTYIDTCDTYCRSGVVRPYLCPAGLRCVANEHTLHRPYCVPDSATPSSISMYPGYSGLRCVDERTIHVWRFGYEWDEVCTDFITGTVGRCFDAPPEDVHADCIYGETCDPSNYAGMMCLPDGFSRYCTDSWQVSVQECETLELSYLGEGPCDEASGACVVGAPCDATFVPYCLDGYEIRCTGTRTTADNHFDPCD